MTIMLGEGFFQPKKNMLYGEIGSKHEPSKSDGLRRTEF
jgi:hypothetical protein